MCWYWGLRNPGICALFVSWLVIPLFSFLLSKILSYLSSFLNSCFFLYVIYMFIASYMHYMPLHKTFVLCSRGNCFISFSDHRVSVIEFSLVPFLTSLRINTNIYSPFIRRSPERKQFMRNYVFWTIELEVIHFRLVSFFSFSVIIFFWIVLSCFSSFPSILFSSILSPHLLLLLLAISSFLTFQVFSLTFSAPLLLLILLCGHILQHILPILLPSSILFLFSSSLFHSSSSLHLVPLIISTSFYSIIFLHILHILVSSSSSLQKSSESSLLFSSYFSFLYLLIFPL